MFPQLFSTQEHVLQQLSDLALHLASQNGAESEPRLLVCLCALTRLSSVRRKAACGALYTPHRYKHLPIASKKLSYFGG